MTDEQPGALAIRTPDQRLRVFVSSTLTELADERAAVARAIAALRLTPVMFELGARPHPPRELYRAYLAQSDVFIGLYWQRYGWIGPGMDISGLEDELRLSGSLPRLLYVKTPAPEREPGLTAMIEGLQAEGADSYRSFRTPRELGRLVRDDLALLLSERFAAGGGAVHAAPSASDGGRRPPRSLPSTSTSLIGREREVGEVAGLLEQPDVRLVTLTGPGGVGKTRLAVAVGERLDDRYPGGAVFVPLAAVAEPGLVLPHVAAAVGATDEGARPPVDAVAERLAETPTLLVLDNLEQVAAVGPDLGDLLARCPGLDVLATSRTALRLQAEREYPVGPLTVPATPEPAPAEELASLPAVRLFVDRARAVRPDVAPTDDDVLAIAEICRRLDGLPLAIELAAARTRLLEPPALLARLERGLVDALGTGPVDLPERQRTLRATVEWSVGLLDDDERRLLAMLSVFVDGWTLEAAADVADVTEDRTLDLLDALAGHSLVRVDAGDAGPRFRMLAAIRELAAERLAAGPELADAERRHAEHFAALVQRADWPAERQGEWAARLRTDEGNVGAAVRWFMAHDIAPLPQIFLILWLFWQMRDRLSEGRAWIQELRARRDALDDRARTELALLSAVTATEVGDDGGAQAAVDEIGRLAPRIDDSYLASAAQLARSWTLPIDGDLDGALAAASAALDGFRRREDPFLAWAALTVGLLETMLGRHDGARRHLTDAEALGGRLGNDWLQSVASALLASLAVRVGDLGEARAQLARSVDAGGGAEPGIQAVTFALVAYAQLAVADGAFQRAAIALGAADGLRRRAGLRAWPSMRPGEAELSGRVARELGPRPFADAQAAGSGLGRREAIALVRDDPGARPVPAGGRAP